MVVLYNACMRWKHVAAVLVEAVMDRGIWAIWYDVSAEHRAAYLAWFHDVHIPEMLAVDGFTSARRLRADDGESYVVVYEAHDVDAAKAAMAARREAGTMARPQGVQLDPPPTVQWFTDLT